MFKLIADEVRLIVDRVKAGNAYRRELYKDYVEPKYVKPAQPKTLSMFAKVSELHEIERQKMQYQYWDEWTGGRFHRVENPYMDPSYFNKHHRTNPVIGNITHKDFLSQVKMGAILRSNPVTGYWEPYNEIHGYMV